MSHFKVPLYIHEDVELALEKLHGLLDFELSEHDDHSVILVKGIDHRPELIESLAVYMVSAIASCVDFDLSIRRILFNEKTVSRDLCRDVNNIVGNNNDIDDKIKTYERNPWLWEGLCHLFLHISHLNETAHPPGRLLAKSYLKLDVKDHGLDIIALYGTEHLGITAGECKAYLERPVPAIRDAANRLREVDGLGRDAEIRATVSQFRSSLSRDNQEKLVGLFWHREKAYFPMVCCDSAHSPDWGQNYKALKRLEPPAQRKYLVPVAIDSAKMFFNLVSDAMRKYANCDS